MVQANEKTLMSYKRKIKWGREKSLPFAQGYAINEVIKQYKIPVIRWGYSFDIIGVETKKQYIFWRDRGGELEFKGLINKK